MNILRIIKIAFSIIFFFALPITSLAQTEILENEKPSIFQKITQENITHLTIEADFDYLLANKKDNTEQKAILQLMAPDSTYTSMNIKIRPRGVYRRKYCEVPPFRINFNDTELQKMGLDTTFDKLKLVTHCMANSEADQVLLKEYWTYRLYNELTPNSFKVHLIKITYINTNNKSEQEEHLAFLIENNKEMAQRIGGEIHNAFGLTSADLEDQSLRNSRLFNFMIGNLDWNILHQRNVKFVKIPEQKKMILVPYDFDMSALVFPSYARLNPDYQQIKFTDRRCIGRFESVEGLKITIENFRNLAPNFLNNYFDCPFLTASSKKEMMNYIKGFYKEVKKEKKWAKRLM